MATERTPLRSGLRPVKYDPSSVADLESTMVHLNVDSGLDGDNVRRSGSGGPWKPAVRAGLLMCFLVSMACVMVLTTQRQRYALPVEGAAWSAVAQPYSVVDPTSLGLHAIDRGVSSKPGPIFDSILKKDPTVPLPTNSWCENLFLGSTRGPTNKVYQLPYVIDTDTHGGTRQVRVYPQPPAYFRTRHFPLLLSNRPS